MRTNEIHLRDPFVLVYEGKYYLYGTRGSTAWSEHANGFDVFVSEDLENWDGPHECFYNDGSFWATKNYWAPEVHRYKDAFYMFASFKSETVHRGTQILRADSPMGPFVPWSDGPVTPGDWEALDGTLYVAKDGTPYIVFCHEWAQIDDGEICAMQLTDDLRAPAGKPFTLFKASSAPWIRGFPSKYTGNTGYVTDGPFLWRTGTGELYMLWASMSAGGYTEGLAKSDNGEIDGHFEQVDPLFDEDGGHAMLFRALDGQIYMPLHKPNRHPEERPYFYRIIERDGGLFRA